MTRAEKVARVQTLRAEGLELLEIAKQIGVPIWTVHRYLSEQTHLAPERDA